jgi:hypothetical protein
MAGRSTKTPVEIASDLGAKAHDLYMHGDVQARAALRVVAKVNPEMFAWLRDRLLDITRQRPEVADAIENRSVQDKEAV